MTKCENNGHRYQRLDVCHAISAVKTTVEAITHHYFLAAEVPTATYPPFFQSGIFTYSDLTEAPVPKLILSTTSASRKTQGFMVLNAN
mmetsp:Transcript_534/g.1097  ORF Transcript_534/g.1097 Transcript_534/m.1097 type:complete len:88 (+) Transcript_534:61-324(+)